MATELQHLHSIDSAHGERPCAKNNHVDVRHRFEGAHEVEEGTRGRRSEIKQLLIALQHELARAGKDNHKVTVTGDIRITFERPGRLGETVDDSKFQIVVNGPSFASDGTHNGAAEVTDDTTSDDRACWIVEGYKDQDPACSRKRQRTKSFELFQNGHELGAQQFRNTLPEVDAAQRAPDSGGHTVPEMESGLKFLGVWQKQWLQQGGWLYDHLTKVYDEERRKKEWIEKRFDEIQNTLGATINYQNTQTMQELATVTKLLHWLESCRKSAADGSQTREEKWRTSSATFHDQSRRERENAETSILREMKEQRVELRSQRVMLMKLLEAQDGTIYKREDDEEDEIVLE